MTHSHEFDINDCSEETVKSFGINVPDWIDQEIVCYKVTGVNQGGCESGSYMPAVTYHEALETMNEHGDDVLEYLEDNTDMTSYDMPENTTWSGIAVHYLSLAVEIWAGQVEDEITEILEDRGRRLRPPCI